MHPVAVSELFDVIASEKHHHLLMFPLKQRRLEEGGGGLAEATPPKSDSMLRTAQKTRVEVPLGSK